MVKKKTKWTHWNMTLRQVYLLFRNWPNGLVGMANQQERHERWHLTEKQHSRD